MQYRRLGKTKFECSAIGFGGAAISGEGAGYGFGEITAAHAIDLLLLAFDKGVNIFDTAPIYGYRSSEIRMGTAFKNIREKVFIVSKSGVAWHQNKRVNMTNDPQVASQMLEQSLKDLQTEYIDFYMIHWPDNKIDIRRPLEVLAKAQQMGKIKFIGLANSNITDIEKSENVCEISVLQSEYNLFNRSCEGELFAKCRDLDLGFMGWGTFDKGILTGRIGPHRRFDKSDCRSWAPWWNKKEAAKKAEKVIEIQKEFPTQLP